MRYIWRLEDGNGDGCYASFLADDAGHSETNGNCPAPWEDGPTLRKWYYKNPNTRKYYFGFNTLKQYKAWFKDRDVRKHMAGLGGKLKLYQVPDRAVIDGNKQSVFIKGKAKVVAERLPNQV